MAKPFLLRSEENFRCLFFVSAHQTAFGISDEV